MKFKNTAEVREAIGGELYVSDWLTVDQKRIDTFAEATGDFQWIHVDTKRAAAESPYGGTIAHGFLTLSLLGQWYEEFMPATLPFCDVGLNYGMNKVRFTNPVPVDSRLRGRFLMSGVEDVKGGLQLHCTVTVEIEGLERPALVAESLVRRQFRQEPAR